MDTLHTITHLKQRGAKREEAASRYDDKKVTSYTLPSSLIHLPAETDSLKRLSQTILNWLNTLIIPEKVSYQYQFERSMHQYGLYAKGSYENRGTYACYAPSIILERLQQLPWLPTTKGFVKPSQAFLPRNGVKEIFGDTVPYFEASLTANVLLFLGIRADVTIAELMGLLREHSGLDNTDPELVERIYEELDIRTERSIGDVALRFSKEQLIFVPNRTQGKKWLSSSECVWEDATDILGNEYAYLKKKYAKRINFFVNRLGVKERVDSECYANRWLKLQQEPLADLNKQRDLLEQLYREIKPIALAENEDKPGWWHSFLSEAKIYSQKDIFCNTTDIIIPDDKFLQNMFADTEDVEFIWYPEDGAFSEWLSFFQVFNVPLLSMSVTEKLVDNTVTEVNTKNKLITESAIKMIASWFKEKRRSDYTQLLSEGTFEQLILLRESSVANDLVIEFCIETDEWIYESQQNEYPAYWDRSANIFYYKNKVSKAAVAKALAKPLMRYYKDLANWIELVLGATNTDRIIDDNWNVPREIIELFRKKKVSELDDKKQSDEEESESSVEPEIVQEQTQDASAIHSDPPLLNGADSAPPSAESDKIEITRVIQPEKSLQKNAIQSTTCKPSLTSESTQTDNDDEDEEDTIETNEDKTTASEESNFNYSDSLNAAFNQNGLNDFNADVQDHINNDDEGILPNPARRAGKLTESYTQNIQNEPIAAARRKLTERTILEPPNEAVRSSLFNWYHGKCQICEETWPQKDGNPFFVAAYIVERQHKKWLDEPGNALCLCAKHFAQWRHATKSASTDIKDQISGMRLVNEGGDGSLVLKFQLIGQEVKVNFVERHAIALRKLVEIVDTACQSSAIIHNNQTNSDTPDDIYVAPSGRTVEIFRHPHTQHENSGGSKSLKQCPYCLVYVSEKKYDSHVTSKCPKRPKSIRNDKPFSAPSVVTTSNNVQAKIDRCKFCGSRAVAGSDVCYSCG